jgi:hypothetical protein
LFIVIAPTKPADTDRFVALSCSLPMRVLCRSVTSILSTRLCFPNNDRKRLEDAMPRFDPELVQVMRNVLEDATTRVPVDVSGTTAKSYLAEAILKAAAQGHTSYNQLLAAATDQIQFVISLFS